MRKFNIVLILIIFLGNIEKGNSQIIDGIGVKTGLSVSNMTISSEFGNYIDYKYKVGISHGYFLEILNSKFFNIVTNLGFYQSGTRYNSPLLYSNNETNTIKLDYLTFDTQVKFKIGYKRVNSFIQFGPKYDYLISHSNLMSEQMLSQLEFNKGLAGITYGLGISYNFNKISVGGIFNTNLNFKDMLINDGEYMQPKFSSNFNSLFFNFFLKFNLNKD